MKFSDVVADVFLPGIAEHFELSAIGEGDDLSLREHALDGIGDRLARFLVNDIEHGSQILPGGIGGGPAGQLFSDGVKEIDTSMDIGGNDGIADAGKSDAEPFALLVEFGGPA